MYKSPLKTAAGQEASKSEEKYLIETVLGYAVRDASKKFITQNQKEATPFTKTELAVYAQSIFSDIRMANKFEGDLNPKPVVKL